ncbi:hypothetical protein BGZ73_006086 [Actinomortierella ambigua]|nr:hypothetical protein BGZ73_006086 [Actinomortierella ambigua]
MTQELPPIGHALSGGVAAALSNVVIYPLDLATTRVQSQSTSASSSSSRRQHHGQDEEDDPKSPKPIEFKRITDPSEAPRFVRPVPPKVHYKNELDALKKVYATEGFRALYSGLGSDTAATLLSNFVYFYIYTWLRQYKEHRRRSGQLSVVQELFLGAEAGVLSRLITNPIHVITTRLQVAGKDAGRDTAGPKAGAGAGAEAKLRLSPPTTGGSKVSARSIIRDIYKEHGLLGFWAGYAPTVILSINPSITYFLFETLKKWLITRQTNRLLKHHRAAGTEATKAALAAAATLSSFQIFFVSAFSKAMASLVTYPLILSKTKLQAKKEEDDEEEEEKVEVQREEMHGKGASLSSLSTSSLPATAIAIERTASSSSSSSSSSATLATTTVTSTTTTRTTTTTTTTTTTKKSSANKTRKESFDGISDVFRTVIRDQGLRGLYVGCQGQVIKGFFSFGLMYMIKDRVVAWMLTVFLAMYNVRKRVAN